MPPPYFPDPKSVIGKMASGFINDGCGIIESRDARTLTL